MIERIVSTEPSSTEMVAYLEGGVGRLVAVSDKCDYPEEVKSLPKAVKTIIPITNHLSSREIDEYVSRYLRSGRPMFEVDWDLIRRLEPDLIVGQDLCEVCALPLGKSLEEFFLGGVRPQSFHLNPHKYMEIAHQGYRLSEILGRRRRGGRLLETFMGAGRELKGLGKDLRILALEWIDPPYVAGLWVSDLISMAGAEPPLRPGEHGRRTTPEEIIGFNPDIVIVSPCGFSMERTFKEFHILEESAWWRQLKAVQKGDVYVVESDYTAKGGPRTWKLARFLAEILTGSEPEREVGIKVY